MIRCPDPSTTTLAHEAASNDVDAYNSFDILQPFFLPTSPVEQELYLRLMAGELIYGNHLRTYKSAHISFNTYLNSFYEAHWLKYTVLEDLFLEIVGTGRFWCGIFRESAAGGCDLIGRHLIDLSFGGSHRVDLRVALVPQGHGHGGRIFVDLEPLAAIDIVSLSWGTRQSRRQEVSLGVGICTFNREPFVLRTMKTLLQAPAEAGIAKIAVVNQGRAFASGAISGLKASGTALLSVYDQDNYGGAGGFTRSAIELLKDSALTHVLFMDDDIELDARHLITTTAFLRFAREPVVVGGHMLDLFRRLSLYEAGNSISPDNQLRPSHHNRNLDDLSTLSALSRVTPCHFNGWWYAAIPTDCFREHGLPAPIFIRGDDLEYGARLHRAGVQTVSLPPVSVWHEPFYAKAPGWQLYYDLRNRLIFAGVYDDAFAFDSPERLLKLFMVHIIRYDYQQVWLMLTALDDFLKGPSLVDEGLPSIHNRVMKGGAPYAPRRLSGALGMDSAPADTPPRPWSIRLRMLLSLARVLAGRPRRGACGVQYTDVPLQWVKLAPSYVLSNRDQHFFQKYSYSRAHTWRLTRDVLTTVARYARGRRAAGLAWKAAQPRLTTEENWRTVLGLSKARPEVTDTVETSSAKRAA